MKYLSFPQPLIEGLITARPNRFIMNVNINGISVDCHCPVTGKIFDVDFNKSPAVCLLSEHIQTKKSSKVRRTQYTVEAISLDPEKKEFIGINQMKANNYMEYFVANNQLPFLPTSKTSLIEREVKIGQSKLDFRIDQRHLLEIKTPLTFSQQLRYPVTHHLMPAKKRITFPANHRLIKHVGELSNMLFSQNHSLPIDQHAQAHLCLVFMYDALPFQAPEDPDPNTLEAIEKAARQGVQYHQINLKINAQGVTFLDTFPLNFAK